MKIKTKQAPIKPKEQSLYNYWQALYLSFFSNRLYIDVYRRWRGFGLLYLLLVVALCTIPISVRYIFKFEQYFLENLILPLKELPPLYIQKGQVSFDKPMPYLMKNKQGDVVGIIDTTGQVTGKSTTYPHLALLVSKDRFYFYFNQPQLFSIEKKAAINEKVVEQRFDKGTNIVFVGEDWIRTSSISSTKLAAQVLVYPLLMGLFIPLFVIFLLVFSFLGQLFALVIFGVKLSFKESCRLLSVAQTPHTIFIFAAIAGDFIFFGIGLLSIVLIAVYYSYALLSIKRESKKMVVS